MHQVNGRNPMSRSGASARRPLPMRRPEARPGTAPLPIPSTSTSTSTSASAAPARGASAEAPDARAARRLPSTRLMAEAPALAGAPASTVLSAAAGDLAAIRGYQRQDLYAVAEVAYHYLLSGGHEIARALLEGLTAVAPGEAYFALAMGLVSDHQGDPAAADRWYRRAGELDPTDGRPDVNRAELRLEARDTTAARRLLAAGARKAERRNDAGLARKARALLDHIERAGALQEVEG